MHRTFISEHTITTTCMPNLQSDHQGCECSQPFEGLRQLGTGFFKSRHPHQPILAPPSPQPPGCYSQPSGCYSQFDSQFPFSPPKARAPMPDRKVHHCMIVFLCIFAAVPRQAGLLRSLQFHIAGHVFLRLCDPFRRIRFSRDPFRRIRAVKHPPRSHRIETFSPSCRESASASHKSLAC